MHFIILGLAILIAASTAQSETFIRDYTYQMSDKDSAIDAREAARLHLTTLLTQELGVYIESELNFQEDSTGAKNQQIDYKSISVSVTSYKVLEERWPGRSYYVKAEMEANREEVKQQIAELIEHRRRAIENQSQRNQQDETLQRMNQQLGVLDRKIDAVQQQLADLEPGKATPEPNDRPVANSNMTALLRLLPQSQRHSQPESTANMAGLLAYIPLNSSGTGITAVKKSQPIQPGRLKITNWRSTPTVVRLWRNEDTSTSPVGTFFVGSQREVLIKKNETSLIVNRSWYIEIANSNLPYTNIEQLGSWDSEAKVWSLEIE